MSLSNINIQVVGRIGNDCKVNSVKDYYAISFSVAVSEKRQNDNQVTSWMNFTYWTKSNKVAQYLTKGKLISVVANWFEITEKDGKTYTNFRVKELNPFLEKNSNSEPTTKPEEKANPVDDEDDDLPF